MARNEFARLLVVRHGATSNNAEGRYTGQSSAPLSPLGLRQVEALADRLAGPPIDAIVTSDLPRAMETAQVIARRHPGAPTVDVDLRELSLGEWEGLTPAEARARDLETFQRWQDDPLRYAPPAGETLEQLAIRVRRALDRWRMAPAGRTTLWVTHGGVVSALLCELLGLDVTQRGRFRRDNASITEVFSESGQETIVRANDTAHLETLGPESLAEIRQVL